MRRRLIKALITASLLSIFSMSPVRGQTLYEKTNEITGRAIEQVEQQRNKTYARYTTASLNIRKKPDTESRIVGTLRYNQKIEVKKWCKDWAIYLKDGKEVGYVRKKYLDKNERRSVTHWIPEYSGYKSFMNYQKITDITSPQWKLQRESAYTGDHGIRMVDGRFCVAIGFAFNPKIGQYFDLILENGTIIPCIVSDEKATEDTVDNMYTAANGCYTEFLVDIDNLHKLTAKMGDISYCNKKWDSPVEQIKMYKKNVLEDENDQS